VSIRILHTHPALQAYELVKGNLVRFTDTASASRQPPTAVLIHGILGSRRNMQAFARRLVEGFPAWQILLVDLRCHGESAPLSVHGALPGEHTVRSAAGDILRLLASLKLFPEVLIGHSFGGKVAMSMAHQFGTGIKRLPRPVKVWALDSLPGEVRSGEMGGKDRPADLITCLQRIPMPQASRSDVITYLERSGFSHPVAAWVATNLKPVVPGSAVLDWGFDLQGIAAMYRSYEDTDLWPFLAQPAEGIQVSFVRAEASTFRWGGGAQDRITALGHEVHLLRDSGHWVHSDNPGGLFDILAGSFGGEPDLHMRHSPPSSPK
jgi:pimeloyl-ACP methyl ester carboxylesterase